MPLKEATGTQEKPLSLMPSLWANAIVSPMRYRTGLKIATANKGLILFPFQIYLNHARNCKKAHHDKSDKKSPAEKG